MIIKVVNKSGRELPQYATESSAGVDLRAAITEPIVLEPLQRAMVPTGLYMEIPKGYEGQVRPRSGLAAKRGVTVLNAPGTIDADYRGEVCVILVNLGSEPFVIERGDTVDQAPTYAKLLGGEMPWADGKPIDDFILNPLP